HAKDGPGDEAEAEKEEEEQEKDEVKSDEVKSEAVSTSTAATGESPNEEEARPNASVGIVGEGLKGRQAITAGLTIIPISPRNTNKIGRFTTLTSAGGAHPPPSAGSTVAGAAGAASLTPSRRLLSPIEKSALVEEGKRALLAARKEKRERERLIALAAKLSPAAADGSRTGPEEPTRTLQEKAAAAVMPWGAGVGVAATMRTNKAHQLMEVLPAAVVPASFSPKKRTTNVRGAGLSPSAPQHYHQRWLQQQQKKRRQEQQQREDEEQRLAAAAATSAKKTGGAKAFLLNLVAAEKGGSSPSAGCGKGNDDGDQTSTPECTPPGSRSGEASSSDGDETDASPSGGAGGGRLSHNLSRRFRRTNSLERKASAKGAQGWGKVVPATRAAALLGPSCSSPLSSPGTDSEGGGSSVSPRGGGGGMA
ncbi:unnamed protein product, partial [Scytosiphon promiscuus]